jgi:hypothetical protein
MPVTINGSAGVTTNSGAVYNGIQSATAVTASGSAVDFTGIPSWAKRITVIFNGLSWNVATNIGIRIGAGSIETTGYLSGQQWAGGDGISTTEFRIVGGNNSADKVVSGICTIANVSGNTWVSSCMLLNTSSGNSPWFQGGSKITASTLSVLQVQTLTGGTTFDSGSINIFYE